MTPCHFGGWKQVKALLEDTPVLLPARPHFFGFFFVSLRGK